jgi:proteic killer suppression protein
MIESIRHKGLRQLFEDDNARGVNAEHVRKLKQILATLHVSLITLCEGEGRAI